MTFREVSTDLAFAPGCYWVIAADLLILRQLQDRLWLSAPRIE